MSQAFDQLPEITRDQMACTFATLLIALSGWFVYRVPPDFQAFALQFAVATTLLPFILLLRHWLASRVGNDDDWGR